MNPALLGGALLAGLVGTPHCLGMCGGLAVAAGGRPSETAAYHLGRVGTYAALGAAAGALGHRLPGPPWIPLALAAAFLGVFALRLGGWAPAGRSGRLGSALVAAGARALRARGAAGRLAFGVINGLLPCGLLYTALALPVASGSAAAGAGTMVAFGLGTVPALTAAAAGLRTLARRSPSTRRAVALLVFLLGLGALAWRAPALDAPADAPPPCHAHP